MLSNGCFVSIPKPLNADTDYGDECVVVNTTHENAPSILITICV